MKVRAVVGGVRLEILRQRRDAGIRRTRAGSARAAGRGWPRRCRASAPTPRAPAPCRPAPCRAAPDWPRARGGRHSGSGRSRCCSCSSAGKFCTPLSMAASGMPYQCSMLVVPNLMSSQALVSSTPGVMRDAQPQLVGLVLHRRHDVAIDAQNLDAVRALLLQRLHPGARFRGTARAAEHRIDENARRRDFALGALLADLERPLRVAAHVADGGDAARQPDIQFVLERLRLAAALLLQVRVRVDQPGQHVLAGGVDHRVGLRPSPRSTRGGHRVQRDHIGDQYCSRSRYPSDRSPESRCRPPPWRCGSTGGARAYRWRAPAPLRSRRE